MLQFTVMVLNQFCLRPDRRVLETALSTLTIQLLMLLILSCCDSRIPTFILVSLTGKQSLPKLLKLVGEPPYRSVRLQSAPVI